MRIWSSVALTALATAVVACGNSGNGSNHDGEAGSGNYVLPGQDPAMGSDASSSGSDAALGTDSFISESDSTTGPDEGGAVVGATDAAGGGPEAAAAGPDATAGDAMALDSGGRTDSGPEASVAEGGSGTCTVGALPSGGTTQTGTNINGTADGLGYGVWSNGSGGSITTFANATAFGASWADGGDFLAHLGLDFNSSKSYTAYGTIAAQFAESRTGNSGGYSSIGMYGWTQKPCVEWYIVEDSFNSFPTQKSNVTAMIDGGTYYLISNKTNGSGGNDCGDSSTQWTQMWSVRTTARQCGTITVSDHFAAWAGQGWSLGNLTSVHVNVEVGGGTGSINFPMANVTTSSK